MTAKGGQIMTADAFAVFDDFTFALGATDEAAPRPLLSVFRNGVPFLDLHGNPVRKVFPAKASARRMLEFCRKFARDEAFRSQTLVRNAFSCC